MIAIVKPDPEVPITIKCMMCQKKFTFKVRKSDWDKFKSGKGYVQSLFPYLTAGERELLISRTCDSCFDKIHPDE